MQQYSFREYSLKLAQPFIRDMSDNEGQEVPAEAPPVANKESGTNDVEQQEEVISTHIPRCSFASMLTGKACRSGNEVEEVPAEASPVADKVPVAESPVENEESGLNVLEQQKELISTHLPRCSSALMLTGLRC